MFSPYHKFANCSAFQKTIAGLREGGNITDVIFNEHLKYHYSLHHKLRSAKYHYESLENFLKTTNPVSALSSPDFISIANMHLDSFFYSSGSALDILAREILIYFNIPLPTNVYFHSARTLLSQRNGPNDPLLTRLNDPPWKEEFSNYRNSLTHELLIGTQYHISVTGVGNNVDSKLVFPLPDDPRVVNKTFKNNPDAVTYCRTTLVRLLTVINVIYGEMNARVRAAGALPL